MATDLTRTQARALKVLRATKNQWPLQRSRWMAGSNYTAHCQFSRPTLQALVDLGHARWIQPRPGTGMPYVIPTESETTP